MNLTTEHIYAYIPDGEEKTNEEKPTYFVTKAQELIFYGHNVAVDNANPNNDVYNETYINTWNNYAKTKGLWVKSLKSVNELPDCNNYVTIIVGF